MTGATPDVNLAPPRRTPIGLLIALVRPGTPDLREAARWVRSAGAIAFAEFAVFVVGKAALTYPYLFKSDLGIPDSSKVEGVDKFAAFMASLSSPLLIALAAVAPLALIFGAGALMLGHRRAGAIIAGTVGALALAASATGLVN
jgi:hypothetical protein